jgi:hypothetical protein
LALDDVERDPLVGEFDGVGVAELVRREPPPHTGLGGDAAKLPAGGVARQGRPRVGPSITHSSGPTGIANPELEPRTEVVA